MALGQPHAYGVRLSGPLVNRELESVLSHTPDERWPEASLSWSGGEERFREHLNDHEALLAALFGGYLRVRREAATAVFVRDEPLTSDLVAHPGLAGVGLAYAHWHKRMAFHAGAVLTEHGAIAVAGPKGAGKSTTLSLLAGAGYPVLADDLVVVEQGRVLAGPRLVDLRRDAATSLASLKRLVVVRGGERWRVTLPGTAASAPLAGWAMLQVSSRAAAARLPVSDRLSAVAAHLILSPPEPEAFMDAGSKTVWQLSRPPDLRNAAEVVDVFAERIARPPTVPLI